MSESSPDPALRCFTLGWAPVGPGGSESADRGRAGPMRMATTSMGVLGDKNP